MRDTIIDRAGDIAIVALVFTLKIVASFSLANWS